MKATDKWNPVLPHYKDLLSNEFLRKHFGLTAEEFEAFRKEYLEGSCSEPFVYWIIQKMKEKIYGVV